MKGKLKFVVSLTLLALLLCGCYFNALVHTKFNHEIEASLREEMKDYSLALFNDITSGNEVSIESLLSNELKNDEKRKALKAFSQIRRLFIKYRFELFDEYYTTITKVGRNDAFTIVPMQKEEHFIVQKIRIPSKYSYIQFWKSDNAGYQYLFFVNYIKEGENWKLILFHLGDYSIQDMTARDLTEECRKLRAEKKLFSSSIYALAAQKIMKPAPFLQYEDEKEYMETIRESFGEFRKTYQLPIDLKSGTNVRLFDLGLSVTTSGISPILKYQTSIDIADSDRIYGEAAKILQELSFLFPDLEDSFEYVILQAYNKLPEDPKKTYQYHNAIFRDGKRISEKPGEGEISERKK